MIWKAWLDSSLLKSRIFYVKKIDIKIGIENLLFLDLYWAKKKTYQSIEGKCCETVAVGNINYPLVTPGRLTKTCSDSAKQPWRVQYQMCAECYFADSDLEFINRIILLCPDRHKNVLREVLLVTLYWMFSTR